MNVVLSFSLVVLSHNGELSVFELGWHAGMPRPGQIALERFVGPEILHKFPSSFMNQ
jgi:hypothetical protein